MLGSQGQLLWRAGALPETLEAGAVGQAIEFRDPGRLTQTTHTSKHRPAVFHLNYSVIHPQLNMDMFNSSG